MPGSPSPTPPLPVGVPAPDFSLRDQHGATFRLSERGDVVVALVFYPFAFSRVCGSELAALQARIDMLQSPSSEVVAISCDPAFALRAQAEAGGLELRTLSDFWPHGAVAAAYGVLDEQTGAARRSTFVVDHRGRIAWSTHQRPGQERDADALVEAVARIAAPRRHGRGGMR